MRTESNNIEIMMDKERDKVCKETPLPKYEKGLEEKL